MLYQWRHEHHPGVLSAERVVGAMRTGLRYVRYAPPLRAVLVCTAAFVVGGSAMWALLLLLARHQLGMDASGYGDARLLWSRRRRRRHVAGVGR